MQIQFRSRLPLAMLVSLAITGMIWSLIPTSRSEASGVSGQQNARPVFDNFDIRYSKSEEAGTALARLREGAAADDKASLREKRSATMREAEDRLSRSVPGLRVEENEQLGSPAIVDVRGGDSSLSAPTRNRESAARSFIARNSSLYGLSESDLKQYSLRADAPGKDGGLSFVYLERKANGIPFFRSEITAAFNKDGELFRTVGEITPGVNTAELDKEPSIGPQDAIALAATRIGLQVDPSSFNLISSEGNRHLFEKGQFAYDIPVELNYFPVEPGVVALAWNVILVEDVHGYMILVDASDGTLYFRKNLANEQTQNATYVVYGSDSPAPLSPLGNNLSATTPVNQGASVGRQTFSLIGEHPLGDPWLNDGDNTTTGNNVDSGMDLTNPDGIDAGTRPVGAPSRVFDFAYNPAPGNPGPGDAPTGANYRFGEAVNMFYYEPVPRHFVPRRFHRGC